MSEVKVVTRRARKSSSYQQEEMAATGPEVPVIAIGVSTGGPPVLQTILSQLPPNFPAALLIVQHISAGFLESLQQWLQQTTHFPVIIPTQGAPLRPGCAYLAPENGLRPAASYLFRSVTRVYGSRTCGILLTGMGTDGAAELKAMRTSGGITIVQDRESSVIFGMPGRAIELDAALHIYTPEQIAGALPGIVERMHRSQTEE
jgi:two-component system chemotaxis response regulator CheB